MAAAVTAIRKNKEKQQRLADEAATSAPGASEPREPKPEKNLATYVSAAYGHISPHYPGVLLPIGRAAILPGQLRACKLYNTGLITWSVASVIIFNFLAIAFEKEIDPFPCPDAGPCLQRYHSTWVALDDICNIIFLCELILNYYGAGHKKFWTSGWNIFDFIVVFVGVLTLVRVPLGPLSMLKMLRALRVFRLFKRIKSLNKIIVALINAIPGVSNAFMIMIIFMSIYAILAVDFFRDFGEGYEDYGGRNAYTTLQGNSIEGALQTNVSAMTARGYTIGDEYYGTFTRALYTLFQVMTGESWSEAIARPLVFGWNGPYGSIVVGIYYVSFILLTQIVLVNVVVAVLLDKFVEEVPKGEEEEEDDDEEGEPAETSTASVKSVPTRLFQGSAAAEAAMPDSNVAELSARVRGVEAKLDQVLDLLKALDKRGGPSA